MRSGSGRSGYIERMIILGLGDEWKLVSANWSGWDIESRDGIRVEVKQSATVASDAMVIPGMDPSSG